MIWIILFAISIPMFIYFAWTRWECNDLGSIATIGFAYTFFGGFILFICLLLSGAAMSLKEDYKYAQTEKTSLTALSDGFFLGADRNYYYTYYAGDKKNGYKQYTARVERSTIYEDASIENAYVLTTKDYDHFGFWYIYLPDETKYEFHIPAGSIERNYKLGN